MLSSIRGVHVHGYCVGLYATRHTHRFGNACGPERNVHAIAMKNVVAERPVRIYVCNDLHQGGPLSPLLLLTSVSGAFTQVVVWVDL